MDKNLFQILATVQYENYTIASLLDILAEYSLDKSAGIVEVNNIHNLVREIQKKQNKVLRKMSRIV